MFFLRIFLWLICLMFSLGLCGFFLLVGLLLIFGFVVFFMLDVWNGGWGGRFFSCVILLCSNWFLIFRWILLRCSFLFFRWSVVFLVFSCLSFFLVCFVFFIRFVMSLCSVFSESVLVCFVEGSCFFDMMLRELWFVLFCEFY